ncbi:Phosphomannomutase [Thermoplasmatales archaeon BRNA1]|nr:Phosphomannomutase [Thermoplasmatales archaeon BRNA1]
MEEGKVPVSVSTAEVRMTPEDALEVGIRLGSVFSSVAVSCDTDSSSPVILSAFTAGLNAAGADVIDIGVSPAPAACFAYAHSVEVIANIGSPNGYTLPSITLRHPDGSQFEEEEVRMILEGEGNSLPGNSDVGNVVVRNDANEIYIRAIRNSGIQADGFIILDCGCGSTSLVAPRALSEAGADISSMNSHIGKKAPRNPGINKTDLLPLGGFVNESVGSIGIAYNGDGTRLAVMDESGKFITGEKVLALMLMYLEPRVAVIPFDSPAIVEDAFWHPLGLRENGMGKEKDRRIIRTRNDINSVIKAIKDNDADIGALTDGTFIFPQIGLCPDAIYASAVISELAGVRSLRNVIGDLPNYTSRDAKVKFDGNLKLFGKRLLQKMVEYDIEEIYVGEGAWKIIMKHGEYVISPEGTDFLEIDAEANDPMYLASMMDQALAIVHWCLSK